MLCIALASNQSRQSCTTAGTPYKPDLAIRASRDSPNTLGKIQYLNHLAAAVHKPCGHQYSSQLRFHRCFHCRSRADQMNSAALPLTARHYLKRTATLHHHRTLLPLYRLPANTQKTPAAHSTVATTHSTVATTHSTVATTHSTAPVAQPCHLLAPRGLCKSSPTTQWTPTTVSPATTLNSTCCAMQ